MKRRWACFFLMNLAALIWLTGLNAAVDGSAVNSEALSTPSPAEVQTSPRAAVAFTPVPEEAAKARVQRAPVPGDQPAGLESAPEIVLAQADKKTVRKKASAMPPTQSYPPSTAPLYQGEDEPGSKSRSGGKGARTEDPKVTTIELPRKEEPSRSSGRGGKKAKAAESVSPGYGSQPGAGPAVTPPEESGKTGRSSSKNRQRSEKKSVTSYTPPPPASSAVTPEDQRNKNSRSKSGSRSRKNQAAAELTPPPSATLIAPAPEPTGPASRKKRGSRSAVEPNPAPTTTIVMPAPEPAGPSARKKRGSKSGAEPYPAPTATMVAPAPQSPAPEAKTRRGGSRSAPPAATAAVLPPPPGPAVNMTPEQEMIRAYQAFDTAYSNSLGKTRRELGDLWGFPMQKLGDNGAEVAYGFRQKGLLNRPEPAGSGAAKKSKAVTYHSPNTLDASAPGQFFSCLVVLWVDNQGRGVVVDGEAVGDCFMVEALSSLPEKFER